MSSSRKTVLITGCSLGGIGAALAREFRRQDHRVFATARNASSISALQEFGIETLSVEVDKPDSISALAAEVGRLTAGRLDVLINNAGRSYVMPALDVDMDEVQATFEANVFGVMRMCKAFAPMLIEAKGVVVMIGSLAGYMPYIWASVYAASKAALHAYTDTFRLEMSPFGVKVMTVVTGGVKSNIARVESSLPENSLYKNNEEDYQRRLKLSQYVGMPTADYATIVVDKILQRSPPWNLWAGAKSWTVWFVYWFLPHGSFDFYFWRKFNLWKTKEAIEKKKN